MDSLGLSSDGGRLDALLETMRAFAEAATDSQTLLGQHGVLDAGIQLLRKPITPGTLQRRVREVLDGQFEMPVEATAANRA